MHLGMLLFGVRNYKKVKEMLEDTTRIRTHMMVSENGMKTKKMRLPDTNLTSRRHGNKDKKDGVIKDEGLHCSIFSLLSRY